MLASLKYSSTAIKVCYGQEDSFGTKFFGVITKNSCSFRLSRRNKAQTTLALRASSLQANSRACNSCKTTVGESSLILIRHGQSLWNERNLFTGCVDVPLTGKGVDEAIEAGKRISTIPIDMIFTSSLIRAQMTAMLVMTQHHSKRIPIIIHAESEQAKEWTKVYSEDIVDESIPVISSWQLNERMYGELQGLNKQETAEKYGKEKVHEWRRSFDVPPPNGESLEMCSKRAVSFFKDHIETQLRSGKNVLVAAHGNSLRSIIMYLDRLTTQEVISLELSTGVPLLYIYRDGEFLNRGSPEGPLESDFYAFTDSLAFYKQELDGRLN